MFIDKRMGCISDKEQVSSEEKSIILMEDQLEYFKNDCQSVDFIIRKYSSDHLINKAQMEDICTNLEIKIKNSEFCPLTEEFYSKFFQNGFYSIKDLLFLGILLSNGVSRIKARLIFEIYDPHCENSISEENLSDMIDTIAEISINKLPTIVSNATNPPASQNAIQVYSGKLLNKFPAAKKKLLKMIIGEAKSISLEKFTEFFDSDETGRIFTPHGFRRFILE